MRIKPVRHDCTSITAKRSSRPMSSPVEYQVLDTANDKKIALAILNRPQTLNGLSLDMCLSLAQQLAIWERDSSIAFVVLRGAEDKSFSAGGDLHGMYHSMSANGDKDPWTNHHLRRFFEVEYRLDYQIHTYSKPILCWGSGIVMGGGVGLMMGASHRVATDTTRYAMPEITIGLYPDVGGSWLFSRLPGGTGLFFALTGARLDASDCHFLGLADYRVPAGDWDVLIAQLCKQSWDAERRTNDLILQDILAQRQETASWPVGPAQTHYERIREISDGRGLDAIVRGIAELAQDDDPWLARAAKTLLEGSPTSARLSFTLLERVKLMSLADVLRLEYIVSLQCAAIGDFQEGIRALLIDKDKKPNWNPASLEDVTAQHVERFFVPPWPNTASHPLADL
jgi:enoyl-CoA hydratase/carnithine racemase